MGAVAGGGTRAKSIEQIVIHDGQPLATLDGGDTGYRPGAQQCGFMKRVKVAMSLFQSVTALQPLYSESLRPHKLKVSPSIHEEDEIIVGEWWRKAALRRIHSKMREINNLDGLCVFGTS